MTWKGERWRLPDDCCWVMLTSTVQSCLDFSSVLNFFPSTLNIAWRLNILLLNCMVSNKMYMERLTVLTMRLHRLVAIFLWVWKHNLQESSELHRRQRQIRVGASNQFSALLIHWFNIQNNINIRHSHYYLKSLWSGPRKVTKWSHSEQALCCSAHSGN